MFGGRIYMPKDFRVVTRKGTKLNTKKNTYGKYPSFRGSAVYLCVFCGYQSTDTQAVFLEHMKRWIDIKQGTFRYCYDPEDKVRVDEQQAETPEMRILKRKDSADD